MEKSDNQASETQTVANEQPIQVQPIEQEQQPKPADAQSEQAELVADAQETEAQAAEKQKRNVSLIEAALYVAGRPLDLNEMCQVINSRSKKKAKKYADILIQEYVARG